VRKIKRYTESADIEADIIEELQRKLAENAPPADETTEEPWGGRIVRLLDRFHFEDHNCLVLA